MTLLIKALFCKEGIDEEIILHCKYILVYIFISLTLTHLHFLLYINKFILSIYSAILRLMLNRKNSKNYETMAN